MQQIKAALDRIQSCLNEIQHDLSEHHAEMREALAGLSTVKSQLHSQANFLSRFAAMQLDIDAILKALDEINNRVVQLRSRTPTDESKQ